MKKNNYISLILLFAFSFVLVHDIIPHHHDIVSEINNHEHHHHDKKEQDHHNENDEPLGFFSHPTHILASTEFIFSSNDSYNETQAFSQFFKIKTLALKVIAVPIKQKLPNFISVIPLQLFYSTHSLRGPPVQEC